MPQILIVDDDPMFREVLVTTLALENIEAEDAANGKLALEMMRINPPDVLLLDLMMPDVSGYEIVRWVRNESDNPEMKIIVVTGQAHVEKTPEGQMVDAILTKPVALADLVDQINKVLIADVT